MLWNDLHIFKHCSTQYIFHAPASLDFPKYESDHVTLMQHFVHIDHVSRSVPSQGPSTWGCSRWDHELTVQPHLFLTACILCCHHTEHSFYQETVLLKYLTCIIITKGMWHKCSFSGVIQRWYFFSLMGNSGICNFHLYIYTAGWYSAGDL